MRSIIITAAALAALSACSAKTPADNVAAAGDAAGSLPAGNALPPPEIETVPPSETAIPTDAWIGKWVGVEGLVLDVEPGQTAGAYALTVTLLDGTSRYPGAAEGETIRFTRDGKQETIRAVSGDQTGLKYLAGKQDCLMIKSGEGFCRD